MIPPNPLKSTPNRTSANPIIRASAGWDPGARFPTGPRRRTHAQATHVMHTAWAFLIHARARSGPGDRSDRFHHYRLPTAQSAHITSHCPLHCRPRPSVRVPKGQKHSIRLGERPCTPWPSVLFYHSKQKNIYEQKYKTKIYQHKLY